MNPKFSVVPAFTLVGWLLAAPVIQGQSSNEYNGTKLQLGVIPGALKFDVSEFQAHPGVKFTIHFNNNGLMAHNWLLTFPGKADALVQAAMAMDAQEGFNQSYVPSGFPILAHSKLIQAGQEETIEFVTPKETGDYPYVCTFPGHGLVMRGIMKVLPSNSELSAPVRAQASQQAVRRSLEMTDVTPKPMGSIESPLVIRTFMPNPGLTLEDLPGYQAGFPANRYNPSAGKDVPGTVKTISGIPAAVGVNFGADFSYCWDTENCRLLYTWTGGFLDMEVYWGAGAGGGRKSFDYVPRLIGDLTYVAKEPVRLRIGSNDPDTAPDFIGYRMVQAVPQFHYRYDNAHVMETIRPGAQVGEFSQHFMIHGIQCPVTLSFDENARSRAKCHEGTWHGNDLIIPPGSVTSFTIKWSAAPAGQ